MNETSAAAPLLSIYIPTFNRAGKLRSCLASLAPALRGLEEKVEVVVSDNCSEDDTSAAVAAFQAVFPVRYERNAENIGPARNVLKGWNESAKGEFVWIIGDDDFARPDAVRRILAVLEQNPEVDFCFVNCSTRTDDELAEVGEMATAANFPDLLPAKSNDFSERRLRWEELLDPSLDGVFLGSLMCAVVRRNVVKGVLDGAELSSETYASLADTYPHALVYARTMFGRQAYYLGYPCTVTFWGRREWNRYLPLIVGVRLADLIDAYEEAGVERERIHALREFQVTQSIGYFRDLLAPDNPLRKYFSAQHFADKFRDFPEFLAYLDRLATELAQPVPAGEEKGRVTFSVLVPTYNHERFLPAALDSLLAQTYTAWEAVVVNDGSSDNTAAILDAYAARDSRIRPIHKQNGGTVSALNEALRHAQGEWICWLSSDDLFEPDKLAAHIEEMQHHPDIRFFYTNHYLLDDPPGRKYPAPFDQATTIPPESEQVARFFHLNYVNGISIAIHRSVFDALGAFNPRYRAGHDFEMWLRISARYRSRFIDRRLSTTRQHSQQDTRRSVMTGIIDSGVACLDFLNDHPFQAMFPQLDLSQTQQAVEAVRATLEVLFNAVGYIRVCGFAEPLFERFGEWLSHYPSRGLIEELSEIFQQFANEPKQDADLAKGFADLIARIAEPFSYVPHDPVALLKAQAGRLRNRGESDQAEIFERYIARAGEEWPMAGAVIHAPVVPNAESDGRMRILFVLHYFLPKNHGGVETYTYRLAQQMRLLGHQVTVLYRVGSDEEDGFRFEESELDGLRVIELHCKPQQRLLERVSSPDLDAIFGAFLSREGFDVVHFQHFLSLSYSLLDVTRAAGVRVCVTLHDFHSLCQRIHMFIAERSVACSGPESAEKCVRCMAGNAFDTYATDLRQNLINEFGVLIERSKRSILENADLITTPSGFMASVLTRYGFPPHRLSVVPLGIESVGVKSERENGTGIVFGFAANIHNVKGFITLVEAFKRVSGPAALHIHGGGQPADVQKLLEIIYGDQRIHYYGRYLPSDLSEIFSRIDVLVQPSVTESFGLAIREAMSAGIPVIASRVGALPEAIVHLRNGVLFESGKVEELAYWLQQFVVHPEMVSTLRDGISVPLTIAEDARGWVARYLRLLRQDRASETGVPTSPYQNVERVVVSRPYEIWQTVHVPQPQDFGQFAHRIAGLGARPVFHLGVVLLEQAEALLAGTLAALNEQLYPDWRLTVVAECAAPLDMNDASGRVTWLQAGSKGLLAELNAAFQETTGDWVGMLEAGDRLAQHALFSFADGANRHPEWRLMYSDEDSLGGDGKSGQPYFKPDFDLELLRSAPFAIGGLMLVRKAEFTEIGGYQPELEGAESYDLALQTWERAGSGAFGHVPDVLYHRFLAGGHSRRGIEVVQMAKRVALDEHLLRLGISAELKDGLLPGTTQVSYRHDETGLVSIVIPTRNAGSFLLRCLNSLQTNTAYKNVEIIVIDQESDEAEAQSVLGRINAGEWGGHTKVLNCARGTSLPSMINAGTRLAKGEYLLCLADAAAPLQPGWLDDLIGFMAQPDIGVVGVKTIGSDSKVSFAGYILGLDGRVAAGHHMHEPIDAPGYFGRLLLPNSPSAVSAACMLTRKQLFEELGGFDEDALANDSSDVDYCLKVWQAGYRVVWTPFTVVLLEHVIEPPKGEVLENIEDQGKTTRLLYIPSSSSQVMLDRWRERIAFDPAYNKNLSLRSGAFVPEPIPALTWDSEARVLPRILGLPADRWGCGEYRIIAPLRALVNAKKVQGLDLNEYLALPELFRMSPDSVIFQRQIMADQIKLMEIYRRNSKAFHIFELDDLLTNIQLGNYARKLLHHKDLLKVFRQALNLCDRFVVSTENLAEEYAKYKDDIVVVQNRIERAKWGGLVPKRRQGRKPRVGWAGSLNHEADLAIIADVVKALKNEVEWVFMALQPKGSENIVEFHAGVPIDEYPAKLASLNLDLALAPLEDVPFNHAKSHLRLLEYGVLGYPVICTDITPYRGVYPVTRVKNRYKDWVDAIREHISDMDELALRGDVLRDHINAKWVLEDHLDEWLKAWLPG